MVSKIIIALTALVALVTAAPGGHHHEHIKIHVPYKIHNIHHHHVEKVPVVKHYPVHVPVVHHVPVHVPVYKEVVKHVPYPVVKEVIKEVPVYKEVHKSHGWDGGNSGWSSGLGNQGWW